MLEILTRVSTMNVFRVELTNQVMNGTMMKIWECYDNLPQQTWLAGFPGVRDTGYAGQISLDFTDYCLDLTNGITTNRNVLQIWECVENNFESDPNQIWTATPV